LSFHTPYDYAYKIVKKLRSRGYQALFAGVRDYIMEHPSQDIDIATDARPEVVLDLFPQTLVVGLAFGVVIVIEGGHHFEVATFREDLEYLNGRTPSQFTYSTAEADALRRDFTINGMFYDPVKEEVFDFVGGLQDIRDGIIRTIGSPFDRFKEDRLRMIRAFRFAARFDFTLDKDTLIAIHALADQLYPAVAPERVYQELSKMKKHSKFDWALAEMHRAKLLEQVFPSLKNIHLNDLRLRMQSFAHMSQDSTLSIYIAQLFQTDSEQELEDICASLKMGKKEIAWVHTLSSLRKLLKNKFQDHLVEWVHFYSSPHAQKCLEAEAAHLLEEEKEAFLNFHQKKQQEYALQIERLQKKTPVVTSAHLKEKGVVPGKKMGAILKEAQRYSIVHKMESPQSLLALLEKEGVFTSER